MNDQWFKNETEAYGWLISEGYEVSRGKFNQDANSGKLLRDGKKFSKFSTLQYGLALRPLQKKSDNPVRIDISQRKEQADMDKAEADARIASVKAYEAERQLDKTWILRAEHEEQMAAFAGLLEDTFRHRVYLDHSLLLLSAGGQPAKASEFANELQMFCNKAFGDISSYKELTVEFDALEEADDDD